MERSPAAHMAPLNVSIEAVGWDSHWARQTAPVVLRPRCKLGSLFWGGRGWWRRRRISVSKFRLLLERGGRQTCMASLASASCWL